MQRQDQHRAVRPIVVSSTAPLPAEHVAPSVPPSAVKLPAPLPSASTSHPYD